MQNPSERVQVIQSKLVTLKSMASQLDKTLVDKTAKEFLLRPAGNTLSDVERLLLPHGLKALNPAHASMWFEMAEFQLVQAERQLTHTQEMVATYGANLQAIGG
jgi:hypothetical protein